MARAVSARCAQPRLTLPPQMEDARGQQHAHDSLDRLLIPRCHCLPCLDVAQS